MSATSKLPQLPAIPKTSHKKLRGHSLIVAGSREKSGASILSSLAAMRAGVGLCTLAVPSVAHTMIKSQLVNVMSEEIPSDEHSNFKNGSAEFIQKLLKDKTALLIGPGLAPDENRKKWLSEVLKEVRIPLVIDAQALSDLGKNIGDFDWQQHRAVITPHEGEMAKLTGLSVEEIHLNRSEVAQTYAKQWSLTVILKGFQTIVCTAQSSWVNSTDHPCLSVAGTGDVLAGILVSFLAQGLNVEDAGKLAVHVHGRCGQILGSRVGIRGVLATDLLNEIPLVLRELDQNQSAS
jgi:NAD(P)H-hydrate epimerase